MVSQAAHINNASAHTNSRCTSTAAVSSRSLEAVEWYSKAVSRQITIREVAFFYNPRRTCSETGKAVAKDTCTAWT